MHVFRSTGSYARPVSDSIAAARERWDTLVAADGDEALGGWGRSLLYAQPFRTARVVVLLHGLTASPPQCAALAEALHAGGDTVLVPRLPHHGDADRLSDRLAGLRARELTQLARECIVIAGLFGERVIVGGFSIGGLLALWAAQHEPIAHAVAISPFTGIIGVPTRLRPFTAYTLGVLPNRFLWWDPVRRDRLGPDHGYPRFPTHAIAEGLALAHGIERAARERAPRAGAVTIVANASETAVNNRSARRLAALWRRGGYAQVRELTLGGLPPSHDIIEPLRAPDLARRAADVLLPVLREG